VERRVSRGIVDWCRAPTRDGLSLYSLCPLPSPWSSLGHHHYFGDHIIITNIVISPCKSHCPRTCISRSVFLKRTSVSIAHSHWYMYKICNIFRNELVSRRYIFILNCNIFLCFFVLYRFWSIHIRVNNSTKSEFYFFFILLLGIISEIKVNCVC